jgi:hypothetical protein
MWSEKTTFADGNGRPGAGGRPKPRLLIMLLVLGIMTLACGLTDGGRPTAPPPPTEPPPTPEEALPPAEAVPTVAADPTAGDGTPQPLATTPAVTTAATTPAATSTLPLDPSPSPAVQPTAAGIELLQPGQSDTSSLAAGERRLYPFQGQSFQPVLFFAEGESDLDLVLRAYEGALTASDLTGLTPESEADTSPAGRPELMVFTAQEDSIYTLVVEAAGQSTGQFTLHLYDGTTAAPGATLVSDNLAEGQAKAYPAQSNGGRPVIVFVDPANQEDLVIEVSNTAGQVINTANYGRGGSAEALYLLPLQTTSYTVTIREAGGAAAQFYLVIISLS